MARQESIGGTSRQKENSGKKKDGVISQTRKTQNRQYRNEVTNLLEEYRLKKIWVILSYKN